LIAESETVVFVVAPEAVKSERCVWEVDRTIALSKRLLPVIFKAVPEHDIPQSLAPERVLIRPTAAMMSRPARTTRSASPREHAGSRNTPGRYHP
jgi:hypothetical protein